MRRVSSFVVSASVVLQTIARQFGRKIDILLVVRKRVFAMGTNKAPSGVRLRIIDRWDVVFDKKTMNAE